MLSHSLKWLNYEIALRARKKGASIFHSKYLVLLERECVLNFPKSQPTPREARRRNIRAAAKNSYIHLVVRLVPKTGNTKIKQKTHPTSPAIGLNRIVPVLAG